MGSAPEKIRIKGRVVAREISGDGSIGPFVEAMNRSVFFRAVELTSSEMHSPGSAAESEPAAAPAIEDDSALFAFLRESHQLATKREVLLERASLLAGHEFSDDDAGRLDLLKRSVEPLRAWLRAPDPALRLGEATLWPPRTAYVVLGSALVAIGLGLQWLVPSVALTPLARLRLP